MSRTLILLLASCLFSLPSVANDHPNIVIILVDDMGYGDPGFNNPDSKIPTPHLDRLAGEGMRFTDAHAPGPLCHMSRYGLMTGRAPYRTDVGRWGKHPLIEDDQLTIADLAKAQGYRTAMVGKWHLGFRENGYDKPLPGGPVDCGFDSYFGIRASTDIPPYFYIRSDRAVEPPTNNIAANNSEGWSPIQGAFWRKGGIAPNLALKNVLPKFTDEAIEFIQSQISSSNPSSPITDNSTAPPWFLYLAYPAPHTPWLPDPKFAGKSGAGMFGDFMMMVDAEIGRVLKTLDDTKLTKDTLVIFSSDNGPVWYDKDVEKFGHDSSGGLRGMKGDAWEAGHRMPFLVRWPEQVKPGTTSAHLLSFTDFLATFADLFGKDLPADAGPDSFSFLPAMQGKPGKPRPPIVMQSARKGIFMIRDGQWKLINNLGSGGFSKPSNIKPEADGAEGQLYNFTDDLGETNNLYLENSATVTRLQAQLKRIIDTGRSR
jgi:arylsulfatase A